MEKLYQQPISPARFQAYLQLLRGETRDDMLLPIAGYNPMAKGHILEKINHLQEWNPKSRSERHLKNLMRP